MHRRERVSTGRVRCRPLTDIAADGRGEANIGFAISIDTLEPTPTWSWYANC
jgi:hypothetical protein